MNVSRSGINTSGKTRKMVWAALLVAIASVLMLFEFPLPFLPPFLKVDLSNVAIMVGGFLLGPLTGVGIAAVKSTLALLHTTTGGVGELADFLCAAALVAPAALIYRKKRTKQGGIWGCIIGSAVMAATGALANLYLIIPFYGKIMPMEAIWAACSAINPIVVDLPSYVLYGALPFNLIKGLVISVVTVLIYKTISKLAAVHD